MTTPFNGTISISGANSGTVTFSGNQDGPNANEVAVISGSINGQPVDGLSTFNNADNQVAVSYVLSHSRFLQLTDKGLSFTAGGISYNIRNTVYNPSGWPEIPKPQSYELTTSTGQTQSTGILVAASGSTAIICFATGTRIATVTGEVAVEALRFGDLIVTAQGHIRPIKWVGHSTVVCKQADAPIHIVAGAFGDGLPRRDLLLSPGHPVLVGQDTLNRGGYLVPIERLMNGSTITRSPAGVTTYWHVELETHDILLAEMLPAESFLDFDDARAFFENAPDHAAAHPDHTPLGLAARCRRVAFDGPLVEAELARLELIAQELGYEPDRQFVFAA